MTIKSISIMLIFIFLSGILHAQYNEREIMTQQAVQMLSLRQYSEAEQLFKQLLSKYPDDVNGILQLIQIYVVTSQVAKADEVLETNRRYLDPGVYSEQRIYVYVLQGEQVKAIQLAKSYLGQVKHDPNKYRQLASYFSSRGFYEQELELYQDARKYLKNDDLFGLEIANTAMIYRLYEQAINEYLKYLEKNPQNSYYVSNQCRTILIDDSTMVNIIGNYAMKTQNAAINELYASSLASLKRYPEALAIYKSLPGDKLQRFAEEQFAALNDEVAYQAYEQLANTVTDVIQKSYYTYRMAQMKYRNNELAAAQVLVQQITSNSQLQDRNLRNRSSINVDARKLMANMALTANDVPTALQWLNQAKAFVRTKSESSELDIEISRLQLMHENYAEATALLQTITDPSLSSTRDYYYFLEALMQNQIPAADSLMNSYVIAYSASKYVNDAIYLMMLMYDLNDNERSLFLQAYRQRQLFQIGSIDLLMQLFSAKPDEELRIMAVEWSVSLSQPVRALELLNYQWSDELIKDYAEVLKLKLVQDADYEQRLARDFLKQNPNSVFSPSFRQLINRSAMSKPNL